MKQKNKEYKEKELAKKKTDEQITGETKWN